MKKYLFYISIFLIIYFLTAVYNYTDPTLWHNFAVGKLFLTKWQIPSHEWGSGAIFYFIFEKFGGIGLAILKFILILLTFLPIYLLNRLKSADKEPYKIVFHILFFYGLLFGFMTIINAQCFSYAFFAWSLYLIELVKKGNRKLLWIFPIMTLLWANIHAGFIAGIGLLLFSGLFVTALISALVTIINPHGFEYWAHLADNITTHQVFVLDWPIFDLFGPLTTALGFKIFLVVAIITLPSVLLKKKIKWWEVLILAATCYLALKDIKHNVFFVIATAGYLGGYVHSFMPKKFDLYKDAVVYGLILLMGALTILLVPLKVQINEEKNNFMKNTSHSIYTELLIMDGWKIVRKDDGSKVFMPANLSPERTLIQLGQDHIRSNLFHTL